ncbi:MAG: serine hydrolase [Anaerolineales bacterium]
MVKSQTFSRRDFLRLASLSAFSLAIPRGQLHPLIGDLCPPWPVGRSRLSPAQRWRLASASQDFIAPGLVPARQVALDIDFIEGRNEDASTMCGPLAIAILQRAGLLGLWAKPHDFWLLNPRTALQPLEETFPTQLFDWLQFEEPISTFDFKAMPLEAGDLVYLHAAPGDTFEHVLVVTRMDSAGRAYTVSNFFISEGTIIEERLLYDPTQPGIGQLADWGNRRLRNQMGNTGTSGFRIWRVKDGGSLEFPGDAASRQLRSNLDNLLLAAPGDWYASIKQAGGPLLYQFNPYATFHPASTIKVPVALGFYDWLEAQEVTDWPVFLAEHGVKGRSYAQLLEATLVDSEEDATQVLVDFLGRAWLEETWLGWGLEDTKVDPRRSSATELSTIFESMLGGGWVSLDARNHLLGLLAAYTPNDDFRLGLLKPRLPAAAQIYNKRGSLVDWPRVVADSGLIELPSGESYVFTLHGLGKDMASYEELETTLDQAIEYFGDFLSLRVSTS